MALIFKMLTKDAISRGTARHIQFLAKTNHSLLASQHLDATAACASQIHIEIMPKLMFQCHYLSGIKTFFLLTPEMENGNQLHSVSEEALAEGGGRDKLAHPSSI